MEPYPKRTLFDNMLDSGKILSDSFCEDIVQKLPGERDLRDKLKELQQIKIEQREAIKEQSLKRFISEDRVDVEI